MTDGPLRTPLHPWHVEAGARFTVFGGWEMPLLYTGIVEEHLAVRGVAGLFDVSHMGKLLVRGPKAQALMNRLSTNLVSPTAGRARYTHFLDEGGRVLDDLIVTALGPAAFFVVCNAAPRARIREWIRQHAEDEEVADLTTERLCLALQGPRAAPLLQRFTSEDLTALPPFRGAVLDLLLGDRPGTARDHPPGGPPETEGWGAALTDWSGGGDAADRCLVTRTGYTGEDGFELFPPPSLGRRLWEALLDAGASWGVRPAGLGARDTLRLEKGYLLSGQDFDGSQTPLETGTERFVKWDHAFIGREALLEQRERDDYDRLVGLRMTGRGVPRPPSTVLGADRPVGHVTSGSYSPVLRAGIALGYVRPAWAGVGREVAVEVRKEARPARITPLPFV